MGSPRKASGVMGSEGSAFRVADHLQRMAPSLRATVEAARQAVKVAAPEAIEIAYQSQPPRSKRAWWKVARYLAGDHEVVGIGTFSASAKLFFARGAEIDEGTGLMVGGGHSMRSISLYEPSDATNPDVSRILRQAFRLASSTHPKKRRPTRDPSIDAYLARASPKSRTLLEALRKTIHAVNPQVEECISYRLPAFRFQGRVVAGFSATSRGASYYAFSGRTLATLGAKIVGYSHTKSALHFDRPLPMALVRKLLEARIAETRGST